MQATGITERHRNLKEAVHEMYNRGDMPGYTRTLVQLPTGEQPFLYHPAYLSPTSYGPGGVIVASAPNRYASAPNAPRRVRATGNTRSLDAWNRLRVPAQALRDAGILPGAQVAVWIDTNTGEVTLDANGTGRTYRVDCYNNIRLSVGRFVAAMTQNYAVSVSAPGVVVAQPQ